MGPGARGQGPLLRAVDGEHFGGSGEETMHLQAREF